MLRFKGNKQIFILKQIHLHIRLLSPFVMLLACFTSFGQSLSLSDSNGPIAPNATIIQSGTPDSNTLLTYLKVTNMANLTINVICRKTELTMLDSTQIYLCWANHCYIPGIFVSPDSVPVAPGETYSGFKAIYAQMAYNNFFIGESRVRYVFFDQNNLNDSVSVTVLYQTFPVGNGRVAEKEPLKLDLFPNPAVSSVIVDYSTPDGSSVVLEIRDVSGNLVQTRPIPAKTGQIETDISNLLKGAYFCSLLVNGKPSLTKKLIVRR